MQNITSSAPKKLQKSPGKVRVGTTLEESKKKKEIKSKIEKIRAEPEWMS